jgi:hypothetical protein
MLASLCGYFFCMITMLTAVAVLLTSFSNISIGNGRHHLRPPVIGRTVAVEVQRHSPVAKEEASAKDTPSIVATAKADTKQIKHYKPKVFARQAQQLRLWERARLCRSIWIRSKKSLFPLTAQV